MNAVEELARTVAAADAVVVAGSGTHREVGGAVDPGATEVSSPAGILRYEPADMTVTVLGGTPVAALEAALAEQGQESRLDPRSIDASVGGVLACGLSGPRRLRYGPLRDRLLEVRFVTGDGRIVRGGGPTVKNVTGYDLPRLFVGSLGTLGVITQVTLRTQPRAETWQWAQTTASPATVLARLFRPTTVAWDGERTYVLVEGHPEDVAAEQAQAGLEPIDTPPSWPTGPHRGRISVAPGALDALARRLDDLDCDWLAEAGIGTVHVAAETEAELARARHAAAAERGWLLREAGAPGLDPFGGPAPNLAILTRIKDAFDPAGKLNPGRFPYLVRAA